MLNQKDFSILELLLRNENKYLTSQKIGADIGVSDKTARKYLKQLDEVIDDDLAQIQSVPGHGYYLKVINTKGFKNEYRNQLNTQQKMSKATQIEEPKDRKHYILHQLFFSNNLIDLEELLNELYVSDSTLMNDLTEINKELKPYGLNLRTSQKFGLSISGEEQSKRHFIMNYFLVNRYQENLKSFQEIASILPDIHLEEILLIVLDEYRNAKLMIDDIIIFNIVIHVALALKRVEDGHQIQTNTKIEQIAQEKELQTAKNIIRRLKASTGISLPEEEVTNIALHLKNKQSNQNLLRSQNINEEFLFNDITEVLKKFEQRTSIDYLEDEILVDGLMSHFVPFLFRLNNNNKIKNPLLEEIKEKHWPLFNEVRQLFSKMETLKNKKISDDEWAYISLHIIAAHERQRNKKRLRTLVICATGAGGSQMLKIRLENELGSKLIIEDVISYFEIDDEKLKGIDLIVSSIDLSNFVFNVPFVNVSVLLNEEDIKAINRKISSSNLACRSCESNNLEKNLEIDDIINQYFDPRLFLLSYDISTKKEAINTLIDLSKQVDKSIDKSFFKDQLTLREEFSSVIFAPHVAVPHPIEGVSNEAKVAVLITPHGLEWDGRDDKVQLTLLMIPDRFGHHHIEQVSWAILPLLENKKYIKELISVADYDSFIQMMHQLLS